MLSSGSFSLDHKSHFDTMDQERFQQGMQGPGTVARLGGLAWAKDWAVLSIVIATVVALVGIAGAAMIFAVSERKQLSELRTRTEDRLANIDRELAAIGASVGQVLASNEASKPDFPKRFLDLLSQSVKRALQYDDPILAMETATAITRKARELRIDADPEQIATLGRSFLRLLDDETSLPKTSNETPAQTNDRLYGPAIAAVGELIGYRSFLLPSQIGPGLDAALAHSAMLMLPKLHTFKPLDSASKIYGFNRSLATGTGSGPAKIDLLNRSGPLISEEYRALLVDGYDLVIDGLDAHNVVFSNCKITYSGSQLSLDNVYFSKCTFEIAPAGKDFARAVLSPSGQVGIVKN
jgi:hypothetical protein